MIDRVQAAWLALNLSSLLTLSACSGGPTTDAATPWLRAGASPGVVTSRPDLDLPTITYTKAASPVKKWPWKVKTITVVCSDRAGRGAHTTPIDGVQYALTGRDASYFMLRGYERGSELQSDPDDLDASDSFDAIIQEDCWTYFRVWDQDID